MLIVDNSSGIMSGFVETPDELKRLSELLETPIVTGYITTELPLQDIIFIGGTATTGQMIWTTIGVGSYIQMYTPPTPEPR